MPPEEKRDLLKDLASGRDEFLAAVAGVSEAEAAREPAPGRWSVLQCAEHVAVVEQNLYQRLLEGRPDGNAAIPPEREARIRERAADRSRRFPAPEAALPRGRYSALAEAVAAFLSARAQTIAFVEACGKDLRAKITTHPILGAATCQEILLMMAAHPRRHASQIAEVRAANQPE
jgi:hypothetical protein